MIKSRNRITIYNIISTIILQGLAFLSSPIFSSLLGKENFGVASVYITWVQLASTVFSLQTCGTISVARINYPPEVQNKYQSSVLSLSTISYLCFSIITIVVSSILSLYCNISLLMVLLGLIHGWGLYVVTFFNSKFTYEFKADKNFVLSVVTSVLVIGLSILLIYQFSEEQNYWGRIIAQASVYSVIGSILSVSLLKGGKTIYDGEYWKYALPICIPTVFHLLAHLLLNHSDKIMIQWMISYSAAGVYSLACTFGTVLNTVWGAFNNSWVPFYFDYTKQKQMEELKFHAKNYIELFTIVTMGFILLAREVFQIYAKPEYWEGTDFIPLFSLGYYFVFLYSFPVNYEFYNKKTKTIALGTSLAALCNIILNIVFIMFLGIQGAVIATMISHGLQFGFHFIIAKRINPGEFPFEIKNFIPGFLAVVATCTLYWLTREMWYIRWILAAFLGIYIVVRIINRKEIF